MKMPRGLCGWFIAAFVCLLLTPAPLQAARTMTPPPPPPPVKVFMGFYLLNLTSVDEKNEMFEADLYDRVARYAVPCLYLLLFFLNYIW